MTARERLVRYALSQIGTAEDPLGSNKQKYGELLDTQPWYLRTKDGKVYIHKVNGFDWCTSFVDASFITTFTLDKARTMLFRPTMNDYGSVVKYAFNYFKGAKKGYTKSEYNPKAGDVIYFQNKDGLSHTGIVVEVTDTTVTTVEGNSGKNCWYVAKSTYKKTSSYIYGYGCPDYDAVDPEPDPKELDGYKVGKTYQIACDSLNVRTKAEVSSSALIVTSIDRNTKVKCLALTSDTEGNTWMRIDKPSAGWICCHYRGERYVMPYGWVNKDGKWYYWRDGETLKNEWVKYKGEWYYLGADGVMLTGWQKIDGKTYYLYPDGHMAAHEWIDGLWLNKDGSQTYPYKGEWKSDAKGKWWEDENGWYPKGEDEKIDGTVYKFDDRGYLIGR